MSKLRAGILGATTLSVGLFAATSAMAITNFTWNPAGGGISTNGSGTSQFSADKVTIADYAVINIPANPSAPGSISETGTLAAASFVNLGGTNAGFVGGTGSGSGVIGATPYQLYISFTSTSHFTTFIPGVVAIGVFDSVSYTLWGDPGGNCDFAPTGVTGCSSTQVALANGTLSNLGVNQVSILGIIPSANVQLNFNPLVAGFFVAPTNVSLQMEGAFINTPGATTSNCGSTGGVNCTVTINGGGGNLDFLATPNRVPEPGTLWLLGAGLLGLAGMNRRLRARS